MKWQVKLNEQKQAFSYSDYEFKTVPSIPHLKQEQVDSLATCQFIKDKMNCCALGGSGTGKTHLMAAIGREAYNWDIRSNSCA